MNRSNIIFTGVSLMLIVCYVSMMVFASSDGNDTNEDISPRTRTQPSEESVFGVIEYEHDLLAPNLYFMQLTIHPKHKDATAVSGYVSQDGRAVVRLRGADTPRALHDASERHRPQMWLARERKSWADAMAYVWNLVDPTHTFKVHNMKVIEADMPGFDFQHVIEADLAFYLGGQWHNLAVSLMQDEHARPLQSDGSIWDPGSTRYSLENPNNPR